MNLFYQKRLNMKLWPQHLEKGGDDFKMVSVIQNIWRKVRFSYSKFFCDTFHESKLTKIPFFIYRERRRTHPDLTWNTYDQYSWLLKMVI